MTYCCAMRNESSTTENSGGAGGVVQSVDRAVSILDFLALKGEAGVTEIAAELGVHKSTAFRLLGALSARGLVEQPDERGKYCLGFGIIRLAGATAARLDLTQQSRPVCEQLAAAVSETVNLAVASEGWAVNIAQVQGSAAVISHNWVGQRTPLHATSSGKVLLAFLPEHEREQILAGKLERYTQNTVTDASILRAQLDAVREQGHASTVEELELGLNAVAAPIRSHDQRVVAAVSVSGPSYRVTEERIAEIAETTTKYADQISVRLGWVAGER